MSGLIKRSRALEAATKLAQARPVRAIPTAQPATPPVNPRIAELEGEVERLNDLLVDQERQAALAVDAARNAGRDEAQSTEADRVAAVEKGMAEALAAWNQRLAQTDRLAVMLARTALGRVFGAAANVGEQVELTIAHHLRRLDEQVVVGVRVSARDFADDALDVLAERLAQPRGRISSDADLAAGACRIDLRLGAVDVDPAKQWAILDRALAEMEAEA